MNRHVLIVDDDQSLCVVLEAALTEREYEVTVASSPDDALTRIETGDVDVVLTDVNMQGLSGVELCTRIVASGRDIPVVVMTAFGSLESAVAAIHAGAYDYVTKPLEVNDLVLTLDRGVKERALREEARRLRHDVVDVERFEGMIGSSPGMKKAFDLIARVAKSEVTALVTGESGSGKELVARAIHSRSPRAKGPFVVINCAAMPEPLLESELFGHTRGAFTDAHRARKGLFVEASGGTLFLDEIGELPLGMQAKLLRALQERQVRPVGGDAEVPFDTRIVAATNRDLEAEVAAKKFREDLFYRINVVSIALPPLRDRGRDVLILAKHLLCTCQPGGQRVIGFKPAVIDAMMKYPWPGNVRELQNCMQRAVALAEFDHLGLDDLPDSIRDFQTGTVPSECNLPSALVTAEELERRYIGEVLDAVGGNKSLAARVLGFDRRTLYRKLEAYAAPGTITPSADESGPVAMAAPPPEREHEVDAAVG